jgi:hypothetical protein
LRVPIDAEGRFRREKAGTKRMAIELYRKRKVEALEGKKLPRKVGIPVSLRTASIHRIISDERSDHDYASEQADIQGISDDGRLDEKEVVSGPRLERFVRLKRRELRNGLTRRQRIFLLEKLVGLNDRDTALAAGYSLSVAENTKQRIWKPRVRAEWERLRCEVATRTV